MNNWKIPKPLMNLKWYYPLKEEKMELTTSLRENLVREIRFASENMHKTENIPDKMFFFSAVYGELTRTFNFEYNPSLVFIHQVIHQVFDLINAKINISSQQKGSIASSIPANLFNKLETSLNDLADKIERDENYCQVLESIANLGYSATGNGSYLYYKGVIKI